MKLIVDKDIPFIEGRVLQEVETIYLKGDSISAEDVKDADALIVRTRTKCDKNLLNHSGVKLIATATIGTDHIDLPWCEEKGIIIRNAPGCNAPGVAQYVFSTLFKSGFNPSEHTLGIIGYGNVGGIVGKWARQMGIRTLVYDPPRKEKGLTDLDYQDLDVLLKESDAISLHVPLTRTGQYPTLGMIGERELSLMKPGALVVNTSRGGVVDEKILKVFLKEKKIRAILDVWENEPEIDRELLELVEFATPHIAGYSEEGKKRGTLIALQALNEILGVKVDIQGLECIPEGNKRISRELIESSYNPEKDHSQLLSDPNAFETFRNNYKYRHEPLFTGH